MVAVSGKELYFIHLTDTHVNKPGLTPMYGVEAAANMRRVFAHIRTLPVKPAFVVVSGDLTHDGDAEDYRYLRQLMNEEMTALGGVPLYPALGNHDLRGPFREGYLGESGDDPYYYTVDIDDVRLIVLDSLLPGEVPGRIDEAQMDWLRRVLEEPASGGTLIALHHPAGLTAGGLLDEHRLINHEELAEAIAGKNVLGLLSGHIHYPFFGSFHGVGTFTAPGASVGFEPCGEESIRYVDRIGYNLCVLRGGVLHAVPFILPGEQGLVSDLKL
ncbi:metallophosphoesterase family protein [Paenibacillus tarimensis]|uniref:metallophosphoesterase family protein n=1 Tax=Paenibacillus tarimensis TaxID=416012 RepID=UPI001F1EB043|nr:metallophosphoesterase [Paenibacillus tarimensis]MCF2945770.1 metallophosphoesterase [Paenibacillus tarimensis]